MIWRKDWPASDVARATAAGEGLLRHDHRRDGFGDRAHFLGFNPMKALVWSGIVQGFSAPPLLLMMMLMTNDRRLMGNHVNGPWTNVAGWTTTGVMGAATVCLVATWFL